MVQDIQNNQDSASLTEEEDSLESSPFDQSSDSGVAQAVEMIDSELVRIQDRGMLSSIEMSNLLLDLRLLLAAENTLKDKDLN